MERWMAATVLCFLAAACASPAPTPAPGTADFYGPADFQGTFKPGPKWGAAAQTKYRGWIVVANLPADAVDDVLPEALELAPPKVTSTTHPVMILMGYQKDGSMVGPFGGTLPVGVDYREFVLLIPFVRHVAKESLHTYVVRMFLDDSQATNGGNLYYGYRKQMASFEIETSGGDTNFDVKQFTTQMFSAEIKPRGDFKDFSDAVAGFANLADAVEILEMPIIGTIEHGSKNFFVCSYFDMRFGWADVRQVDSTQNFEQPYQAGMSSWVGTVWPSVTDGAFEVKKLRWRLRLPHTCEF